MKKLLLIIISLFIFTVSYSQVFSMKATHFSYRTPGYSWSDWEYTSIPAILNINTRQIVIDSQTPQIFSFEQLLQQNYSGYSTFTGYASDIRGITVKIEIKMYDDGDVFLKIFYSDIEYKYRLIFLD